MKKSEGIMHTPTGKSKPHHGMLPKHRGIFIALLVAAAVAVVISSVLLLRGDVRFIAADLFRAADDSVIKELQFDSIKTITRAESELQSDSRIRFDQSLMLVNGDYPIPDCFDLEIVDYGGAEMDSAAADSFAALSDAVKEQFGEKLYIMSAYRSADEQKDIATENGDTAANAGESEHQTGLALDVYVPYFAGYGFLKTDAGQFVNSGCHNYGFIIRYPYFGKRETGIPFEPWHLRYVGTPHAEIMYKRRMTLEEYILSLEEGKFYTAGEYIITRQSQDGSLTLPEEFSEAVISPDNTGCFIMTIRR